MINCRSYILDISGRTYILDIRPILLRAEAPSWISVTVAIFWISVAEAISWIYTVREIVSPNALHAKGERISIPHSGVRLYSVALHLLSKQPPPLLSPLCTHAPHKYFRKFPKVEAEKIFFL